MTLDQARLGILPEEMQERFDERAAIIEFEGETERGEAEVLAFKIIMEEA